jgi:hypothetical protein
MLHGGCFCGFVRYRVTDVPSHQTHCHCGICRRTSAAPFVAWFSVSPAGFQLTDGEPVSFRSSEHGTRSFCPRCGTPLTFRSSRLPDEIDVTACSLDEPEAFRPKDHTRTSSMLSWVELSDRLPRFREARP